jgi:chromosome segregation ATPase
MENDWDLKFKEVVRENDYLEQRNRDLEAETKRLQEENRQLLFGVEDKVRDAGFKAREEERQKNLTTIRQLENALRQTEEEIYRYQRDLEEKELSYNRKMNFTEDKLHQAEEEIKRLKYEVNTNVDYFNKEKLRNESLQNELLARDNAIIKMESDIRELKKNLHNKEVLYQDQVEILQREGNDEKERNEEVRRTLQRRIEDLEKQNRSLLSELNKVKSDMQRLTELLVTNISQTVYRTFSELK